MKVICFYKNLFFNLLFLGFSFLNLVHAENFKNISQLVQCQDSKQCHPSVAQLMAISTDKKNDEKMRDSSHLLNYHLSGCTAFMIGDNMAMTNRHCLPADISKTGADCSKSIFLLFPEIKSSDPSKSYPFEAAKCSKVFFTPHFADDDRDYAFLELKKNTNRPSVSVSQDGFYEAQKLTVYKIDPTSEVMPERSELFGIETSQACKANLSSFYYPAADRVAPIIILNRCQIIHGNSGSPIFSEDGRVHGIVNAFVDQTSVGGLKINLPTEKILKTGVGVNFSCIRFPDDRLIKSRASADTIDALLSIVPEQCKKHSEDISQYGFNVRLDELFEDLKNEIYVFQKNSKYDFQLKFNVVFDSKNLSSRVVVGVPDCFHSVSQWSPELKKNIHQGKSTFLVELPRWFHDLYLSGYLVPKSKIQHDQVTMSMIFDPLELITKKQTMLELKMNTAVEGQYKSIKKMIGFCPSS